MIWNEADGHIRYHGGEKSAAKTPAHVEPIHETSIYRHDSFAITVHVLLCLTCKPPLHLLSQLDLGDTFKSRSGIHWEEQWMAKVDQSRDNELMRHPTAHLQRNLWDFFCISEKTDKVITDPSYKSHNILGKYHTLYHFVTEMCTFLLQNGALWDMGLVHCGICATSILRPVWHHQERHWIPKESRNIS